MKDIIIRDVLYNYISIERNSIIHELIDTLEFQRLRYIKQLGVSFLTYPCATHMRLSHGFGTYHLSKRISANLEIEPDNQKMIEIAALLHDIGHTALSHVFEKEFTLHDHEYWTKEIIENKNTDINFKLSKNYDPKIISKRFIEGPSDPPYYHGIISSQLDIDRFDFLLRDSYFTGNPSGMFDIERLLRVIKPQEGLLTIDLDKGKHVLEHYVMSRYLMYNVVYEHRVTVGIGEMLKMIIKRAIDNEETEGISVYSPLYPILNGEELDLEDYIKLKDDEIFSAITVWKDCKDTILRDLCRNFLTRDILKPLKCPITITKFEENKDKIRKVLEYYEIEPDYNLIFSKGYKKATYIPYDVTSKEKEREDAIYFNDGTEIVEKLPQLEVLKLEKQPTLYLPSKVHDEVRRIIEDKGG